MIKILIIKVLAKILFSLMGKRRKIDVNQINTILVNRADKLGDAVISLPFLIELNKRFNVTVLTSSYNDNFLNKFLPTQIIIDKPLSLADSIRIFFHNLIYLNFPLRKNLSNYKYDLYLDLIGIRGLNIFLRIVKQNLCRYYIGYNMLIWNYLLDYAFKGSVELDKKNETISAKKLIQESLGITLEIPDYLDFSSKIKKPEKFKVASPYILLNIAGFNKFRGPSVGMYAQLVDSLDFDGTIVVMDELGQPNLEEFKRKVNRKNSIFYLDKDYSIWELLYISQGANLYIGSDLGITHILQFPTNSVIFFATGTPEVWKPYSKNGYKKKRIGKIIVEDTINSIGLKKKIIYRPVWCRPCYDVGCRNRKCICELERNIQDIIREIKSML